MKDENLDKIMYGSQITLKNDLEVINNILQTTRTKDVTISHNFKTGTDKNYEALLKIQRIFVRGAISGVLVSYGINCSLEDKVFKKILLDLYSKNGFVDKQEPAGILGKPDAEYTQRALDRLGAHEKQIWQLIRNVPVYINLWKQQQGAPVQEQKPDITTGSPGTTGVPYHC